MSKKFISLTFFAICFFLLPSPTQAAPAQQVEFDCTTITEIPQVECEALIAFYDSMNGNTWSAGLEGGPHPPWFTTNAPCEWYGISCSNGHIEEINFHWYLLELVYTDSGVIPPEIANLTQLKKLSLAGADLTGGIPSELGNLTNLEVFKITNNNLSGSIPPELGNLSNLQYLDLSGNDLTGVIPEELANLFLTSFNFSDTNVCIPDDVIREWLDTRNDVTSNHIYCSNMWYLPMVGRGV